jgi:tRNA-binding EMAP/Myf-like protein
MQHVLSLTHFLFIFIEATSLRSLRSVRFFPRYQSPLIFPDFCLFLFATLFTQLRVGKVLSVVPHPDPQALNLVVTTVDLGPASGIRCVQRIFL